MIASAKTDGIKKRNIRAPGLKMQRPGAQLESERLREEKGGPLLTNGCRELTG